MQTTKQNARQDLEALATQWNWSNEGNIPDRTRRGTQTVWNMSQVSQSSSRGPDSKSYSTMQTMLHRDWRTCCMSTVTYVFGTTSRSKSACYKCNKSFEYGDHVVAKKAGSSTKSRAYHEKCWEKLFHWAAQFVEERLLSAAARIMRDAEIIFQSVETTSYEMQKLVRSCHRRIWRDWKTMSNSRRKDNQESSS